MYEHEEAIERIRQHLRTILLARQIFPLLTITCFAWGTAVLMLRVLLGWSPMLLLWGGLALPVAVIAGVLLAVRRTPSSRDIRALLDKTGHCGGLLLTSEEKEIGAWKNRIPPVAELRCRWAWKRPVLQCFLGAAFVVAGLLLPLQSPLIASSQTLQVGKEVKKLTDQIEILEKEEALKPKRAKELENELEEITAKASAKDPEQTFDALDHLQDLVKKAGNKAGEAAMNRTEKLAMAQTLAEGLQGAGESINADLKAEAMAELAKLVKQAAKDNKLVQNQLDKGTAEALKKKNPDLTGQQMKELAKALQGAKTDIAQRLQRLQEAGLVDPNVLKRNAEVGTSHGQRLANMLQNESKNINEAIKAQNGKNGKQETGKESNGQKGDGQKGMGQKGEGQKGEGQKGMGQKGEGQKGDGQKGMGQKGDGQKGMGQKGNGQQGMGQKGMGQKGNGQQGMGQKGNGQQGMGQKGMGQKGMGQKGMGQQGMGQKGNGQQGNGQKGNGQQGNGQKGNGQQGNGQKGNGQKGNGGQGKKGSGQVGSMSIREMLQQAQGQPGSGGINRGRGDAPLTYGKETSEQGAKFKETLLPRSKLSSLKDSYQYGETWGVPGNDSGDPATSQNGSVKGQNSGKGSAVQQQVLPVHRGAVRRYFDRSNNKAAAAKKNK